MNPEEIEKWREAGRITSLIRNTGKELIKKGGSMRAVCDKLDAMCVEQGVVPAFPAQISCDEVAAHFCVDEEDIIFDKQVAKLDCGASVDGFLGDSAVTVDLSGENKDLVKAAHEALDAGIELVKTNAVIGNIGKQVEEVITSYGFVPVVNLCGHGIAPFELHTKPTIPNIANNDNNVLQQHQIITIEPFATTGVGQVVERGAATVFMQQHMIPVRDAVARKVLKEILNYEGLPFAKRHLRKTFPNILLSLTLQRLNALGILESFPPLVEKSGGLVSQAEHTLLVTEDGCEVLTR